MKKIFLLVAAAFGVLHSNAQVITQADFDAVDMSIFDTNGDGKVKDDEAALAIKDLYSLDKNNAITRVEVIDNIDKTKEQIYVEVNNWFVQTFNSGKSVIQLNDKDAGCIIGKGYIQNMGSTESFFTNSKISAYVIIRVDIRDGKMRVTTTIQEYEMEKGTGTGMLIMGAIACSPRTNAQLAEKSYVSYTPSECFPFTNKQKKEGAKGFVKGHIYSLIMINKLKEAVLNGLTGTEDDW